MVQFFVSMACRESRGCRILLCLGLFVVASSFCNCTVLTRLKTLDRLENTTQSQGQATGSRPYYGRLLVGEITKKLLKLDTDFQADMVWADPWQAKAQVVGLSSSSHDYAAVERLLKLEPKVECSGSSMKLQVQNAASTPGSLLFVDRGRHVSPLPLSHLPSSCGYTIRSTRQDLVLVAPYDGCFVSLEEDSYVLPLRWSGVPVRMSCPLMTQSSVPNPPMVTCHYRGMVVKTDWTISADKIKVNVNGDWEPLMKAASVCFFSVVVHTEGVVISALYGPCLQKRDGMHTLILAGEGETKISCPAPAAAQSEPIKSPPKTPEKQPPAPSKGVIQVPQEPSFPLQYYKPPVPVDLPDTKPTATSPSTVQPTVQQQPYYFYPFKPQLPEIQTPPTQVPATKPLLSNHDFQFIKFPNIPSLVPQKPKEPTSIKSEHQENIPLKRPSLPSQAPVPQEPKGQTDQSFYQYPFYPLLWPQSPYLHVPPTQQILQPTPVSQEQKPLNPIKSEPSKPIVHVNQAPSKPTSDTKKPSQPVVPDGQHYQLPFPYVFYPQQEISYPQPSKTQDTGTQANTPIQRPAQSDSRPAPPLTETPVGNSFNFFFSHMPQLPQPVKLPTTTTTQQQQPAKVNSDIGNVPQRPQESQSMSSLYCSQFCTIGVSNCCPQFAFHQHLHHLVPTGTGRDGPVFPVLFPSLAQYGFGSGLVTVPPQEPIEVSKKPTSAPTLHPSPAAGNQQVYLLPPDGNNAPPSDHRSPSNAELPPYPYFIPNTQYQLQPQIRAPQTLSHGQPSPSEPQASGNSPGNQPPEPQMSHLLPVDMNNPSWLNFMHHIGQQQQQQARTANKQNEPTAAGQLRSVPEDSNPREPAQSQDQRVVGFPYFIPPGVPVLHNYSQQFVSQSNLKLPNSNFNPYTLLQHGPPRRQPSTVNEELPFRGQVPNAPFPFPAPAPRASPQNVNPSQEIPHHTAWLGKMASKLPANVGYMPWSGSRGVVPLPLEPSFSEASLKPERLESLREIKEPMTPAHDRERTFQFSRGPVDG